MKITKIVAHIAIYVGITLAPLGVAHATLFNYSYEFDGTNAVTGSFDGTATGNSITGLSNISVMLNGVDLATPNTFVALGFDGDSATHSPSTWTSAATVSINGVGSNFGFFSPDFASYTDYFYIIPWCNADCLGNNATGVQTWDGSASTYTYLYNGDYDANNWQVTAVPEPSIIALFAVGLLGLGFARRRKV
jgi:hypothetical protein